MAEFPNLSGLYRLDRFIFSTLQKETAPYDDRSFIGVNVTAPEGASYDYMDRFMTELSELINDSIPEKKVSLIITSPGFGSSSVNSGRARISLVEAGDESVRKEILCRFDQMDKNKCRSKGFGFQNSRRFR